MTWRLYDTSFDLVAACEPIAVEIARRDRALAGQLRRAVASVPLNLAEGDGRQGADRRHHFRVALGSAKEVRAALRVAGLLKYANVAAADQIADAVCAMLYPSTR